jgi:hypothetical protein
MSILSAYRELRNDIKEREAFKQKVWANEEYIRAKDFLIEDAQVSCEAYNENHFKSVVMKAKYIAMRLCVKSINVVEYKAVKHVSIKPKLKYLNPKGLLKLIGIPLLIILLTIITIFSVSAQEYHVSTSVKILEDGIALDPSQYVEKIDSIIINAGDKYITIVPYHITYKLDSVLQEFTEAGEWVQAYVWTHSFEKNYIHAIFNFIKKENIIILCTYDNYGNAKSAWSFSVYKTVVDKPVYRTEIVKQEP